jgi:hypothetical protein
MPYRNYGGPEQYYGQGDSFDPYTGRMNGGALVMQVINQLAALKKQKQQEGWEVEDRDINKRYKEAQISNLYETPQPREPAQKGYPLPPNVRKQVAKFHELTDETEYDSYDPQMQQKMFEEFLDAQGEAKKAGVKGVTNKTAIAKIRAVGDAVKLIGERAKEVSGNLNAMTVQPMSDPTGAGREAAQKTLSSLRRVQWRIGRIARMIDADGNLPKQYEDELNTYLNSPSLVESGEIFSPATASKSSSPKATAAEEPPRSGKFKGETATSPKGQVYVWDGSKWAKK